MSFPRWRNPALVGFAAVAVLLCVAYLGTRSRSEVRSHADPGDPAQVARGRAVYEERCATCHGAKLEGQPEWRIRLANGRLPAPPHDDSGHTWHHTDEVLFGIVKNGLVPPYAPADYPSDMPAFRSILTHDDIWAVLAFIESRWSSEIKKMRNEMLGSR